MPDGQPRNYPSTGSAVLLPLRIKGETVNEVEVLVCGGAPKGAFANANNKGIFDGVLDTCGRIKISDPNPHWLMETMPLARVMGDMLLLPNGHVLIINGASAGVTMVAPSFNTHSFSMNQRLLVLDGGAASKIIGRSRYQVIVRAPPSGNIAPAGNYLMFVVHKEIPSPGIWVQMQ
ncbi:putative glyoxal oxidase, immunoglobulin-like, immunoglobulin E-set [Helianthus debilis subsp. tardiflorus]